MVIGRMTVKSHLEQSLAQEDPEQIEWLTDICWLLYLVLQFSFQCELRKNNAARSIFMKRMRSEGTRKLHYTYEPAFPHERPPGDEDFEQVLKLYSELKERSGHAKLLRALINECWDLGIKQHHRFQQRRERLIFHEGEIVCAPAIEILSYDTYADLRKPAVEMVAV